MHSSLLSLMVVAAVAVTLSNGFPAADDAGAFAEPVITALVQPGGRAEIRPESYAQGGGVPVHGSRRSGAVASPVVRAYVGSGGSLVVEPKSTAFVGTSAAQVGTPVVSAEQVPVTVERVQVRPVEVVYTPKVVSGSDDEVVHSSAPASGKYSYEYGYSAPDAQNPEFGINKAYVKVNQS